MVAGCIVLDVLLVALHFDQNEVKMSKVKIMTKYSHKGGRMRIEGLPSNSMQSVFQIDQKCGLSITSSLCKGLCNSSLCNFEQRFPCVVSYSHNL